MIKFHNALFVSQGVANETAALTQAISLARNNGAALKALVISPDLPKSLADYKDKYQASLVDAMNAAISNGREITKVSADDLPIPIEVEYGNTPAVRVIRYILKNDHDLLVKQVEPTDSNTGFRALDMELLRKCPCPLWLSRTITKHRDEMKVAVAIDPTTPTPESRDLAIRLLKLSRTIADSCNGHLSVISCWDFPIENSLRNNGWITMREETIEGAVNAERDQHRGDLEGLINESGISGSIGIAHLRGEADRQIPSYVSDESIDILVMGTVGRTGIPGFVIGNTAENVIQKLGCSLLAVKPNGFISPVKAY